MSILSSRLLSFFGGTKEPRPRNWKHLSEAEWPAAIYAIGDVHGCLSELIDLEGQIERDAHSLGGVSWIVYLGDYLDRGPDPAGIIDHLLDPAPAGLRRVCLAGNHEAMALEFFSKPRANADWLRFGGDTTLASYGISTARLPNASARTLTSLIQSHIPQEHIEFLENLHLTAAVPGHLFVHAGLKPGLPVNQQTEADLLWIRDEFFRAGTIPDLRVIHGHTPGPSVVQEPGRICVDTGAYATGVLSAVRLTPDGQVQIFETSIVQTSSS